MTDEEHRVLHLEYENMVLTTLCKFGAKAEKPYFKPLLREMITHFDYILTGKEYKTKNISNEEKSEFRHNSESAKQLASLSV